MSESSLATVADAVLRRAQRQGYVVPSEIRAELHSAGLGDALWKDVVAHLKNDLHYRQGRYHHVAAVSPRLHHEQEQQRVIAKAIKALIKEHKDSAKQRERRGPSRVDFIQPVRIRLENGTEHTLLSRDLSPAGIRLIGTQQLLGHKIHVTLTPKDCSPLELAVRILWTCAVGDDLFENGGNFLEMLRDGAA
jgi:hypothetical protein